MTDREYELACKDECCSGRYQFEFDDKGNFVREIDILDPPEGWIEENKEWYEKAMDSYMGFVTYKPSYAR